MYLVVYTYNWGLPICEESVVFIIEKGRKKKKPSSSTPRLNLRSRGGERSLHQHFSLTWRRHLRIRQTYTPKLFNIKP